MNLDVKTLVLFDGAVVCFMAAVLYFYYRNQKTYPGFRLWVLSSFTVVAGYLSLVLRGAVAPWPSILLTNGLFAVAVSLRLDGMYRFLRGRSAGRLWYAAPLLVVAVCAWFTFVSDRIEVRNLSVSTYLSLAGLVMARELLTHVPKGNRAVYRAAGVLLLIYPIVAMARALVWFMNPGSGLFQASSVNTTYFLVSILLELGGVFACLMMNSQRLEADLLDANERLGATVGKLEKAMSEIKVLSGLLPICAGCKKVRDDRGYWRQIESYISEHTDAQFSHGLCPECKERLYPELAAARAKKDTP